MFFKSTDLLLAIADMIMGTSDSDYETQNMLDFRSIDKEHLATVLSMSDPFGSRFFRDIEDNFVLFDKILAIISMQKGV